MQVSTTIVVLLGCILCVLLVMMVVLGWLALTVNCMDHWLKHHGR